jgi:hypothetical protein
MMADILSLCPLTSAHFRLAVPIPGTFAVWRRDPDGKHSLVIPQGYWQPGGIFLAQQDWEKPCLNLVKHLAQLFLGHPVPLEEVLSWPMETTTHGDLTVYTIGVPRRCDVCGHPLERLPGFVLSAKQIVSTPYYWQVRYEHNKARWAEAGISSFDQYRRDQNVRESEVRLILTLGISWLVCDACIPHFAVDRDRSGELAGQWWRTGGIEVPSNWAGSPSDVNMG